jgi:hypothetical protein
MANGDDGCISLDPVTPCCRSAFRIPKTLARIPSACQKSIIRVTRWILCESADRTTEKTDRPVRSGQQQQAGALAGLLRGPRGPAVGGYHLVVCCRLCFREDTRPERNTAFALVHPPFQISEYATAPRSCRRLHRPRTADIAHQSRSA